MLFIWFLRWSVSRLWSCYRIWWWFEHEFRWANWFYLLVRLNQFSWIFIIFSANYIFSFIRIRFRHIKRRQNFTFVETIFTTQIIQFRIRIANYFLLFGFLGISRKWWQFMNRLKVDGIIKVIKIRWIHELLHFGPCKIATASNRSRISLSSHKKN